MKRREFLTAVAAAGLTPARATASTPFPVHYKRANPFDSVLRYVVPGSDEFAGEQEAFELEARLARIFAGKEASPKTLQEWVAQKPLASRFYVLPEARVRFEIKTATAYHVGLWALPDFREI